VDQKSKNLIFHKYQESTLTSIFGQIIGHSLKNIVDSLGFAYDFAFGQNLKIFQNVFWKKSFQNAKRHQSFRGGIPKIRNKHIKIFWASVGHDLRFFRSSSKLRYEKNMF
jgi:hypothetical protein